MTEHILITAQLYLSHFYSHIYPGGNSGLAHMNKKSFIWLFHCRHNLSAEPWQE